MALAILNPTLFVDQDASVPFEMDPKSLDVPLQGLGYQFKWDEGVNGIIQFKASVFPSPYDWETLVSCTEAVFTTADTTTRSMIIAIPGVWFTAAFLKFTFNPVGTSVGNMTIAERIVPL